MQTNTPIIQETNTDFEVRSLDSMSMNESQLQHKGWHLIRYFIVGILFGIFLVNQK